MSDRSVNERLATQRTGNVFRDAGFLTDTNHRGNFDVYGPYDYTRMQGLPALTDHAGRVIFTDGVPELRQYAGSKSVERAAELAKRAGIAYGSFIPEDMGETGKEVYVTRRVRVPEGMRDVYGEHAWCNVNSFGNDLFAVSPEADLLTAKIRLEYRSRGIELVPASHVVVGLEGARVLADVLLEDVHKWQWTRQ